MTRFMGGGDEGEPLAITANVYSGAVKDDLVKKDDTGPNKFAVCADGDLPVGRVAALGPGADVMDVHVFAPHWRCNLPYTGAGMDVGDSVVASATAKTVKAAAAGANYTRVVAKDLPTGTVQVEFEF